MSPADDQIASLIDQLTAAVAAQSPGDKLAIHALIQQRARQVALAAAKAVQPSLGLVTSVGVQNAPAEAQIATGAMLGAAATATPDPPDPMAVLTAFFRAPLTSVDTDPGGMDQLCLTVQDLLDAGNVEDAIFGLARIARKAWAWQPHLGPVDPSRIPTGATDAFFKKVADAVYSDPPAAPQK